MAAPVQDLDHIDEGYAYKDGNTRQIYDAADAEAKKQALFKKCIDFGVGPLSVHGCVDLNGPSVSVEVTLLGVTLAQCDLSLQHQDCKIGGSVDGFKAELDLTFSDNPLQLTIDGQLCAPIVGCDTFHRVVPL